MDLNNQFLAQNDGHDQADRGPSLQKALEYLDRTWLIGLGKTARWMDLVGDYAGTEPFVVDGESLLQLVLDDPLLALGLPDDPNFQIIHAYYMLERFLQNLIVRSANFDVVLWRDNRCGTLRIGDAKNLVSSRVLAHVLLVQHLQRLSEGQDFEVKMFDGLADPAWVEYMLMKKPMFVMMNDGGRVPEDASSMTYARVLVQRAFVHDVLSQGLSVASLSDVEFRDSKMLSFVHETVAAFPATKLWRMAADERLAFNKKLITLYPMSDILVSGEPSSTVIKAIGRKLLNTPLPGMHASLYEALVYLYLSNSILLEGIPIELRARSVMPLHPDLQRVVIDVFLPRAYTVSATVLASLGGHLHVDGRFFASLLQYSCTPAGPMALLEHSSVNQVWLAIRGGLPNLGILTSFYQPSLPTPSSELVSNTSFSLLPFSNPVFDTQLSSVQIKVHDVGDEETDETQTVQSGFQGSTIFSDTAHWHNPKSLLPPHLGGEKPKPVNEWQRKRYLRSEQRLMASIGKQAATLTGASGNILEPMTILPVGASRSKHNEAQARVDKKVKAPKAVKLSSADLLRQKIKQEKESQGKDSSSIWWKGQLDIMSKMDASGQIKHVEELSSKRAKEDWAGTEIAMCRLHLEIVKWVGEPERESMEVNDKYSVSLLKMVRDISKRKRTTPTISTILSCVLRALGLDDYVSSLTAVTVPEDSGLTFTFVKLFRSKGQTVKYDWMKIREHPVEWQLRLFGEFMDRSMDSASDSRVSFEPDAWQRRVLDCIDKRSSLLVVAPTSAGKTFISFYAMERVLRESDEGIFVYVAPTKALIMQIAAEVYARFRKNLNAKTCWAVHTRDYRIHNPQNCQILVTVPEVLSIMLLSPPLARHWTPRIKWICLDEIHSIGQQEGGTVWEQLILMAPCPVIGLSATVGDPEGFSDWLGSVQKAHGFEYQFIQHPHRYSHLRKFFYILPQEQDEEVVEPFKDLSSHMQTQRSRFIHPITSLSFGAKTLPDDLALESGDMLTLYRALKTVCKTNLEHLDPRTFFEDSGKLLVQKDVLGYEMRLKEKVSELADARDRMGDDSSLKRVIRELQDPKLRMSSVSGSRKVPSLENIHDNLIFLLADLNAARELPAILFCFDRSGCEKMAQVITKTLQNAEKKWRSESKEWIKKVEDWEKWQQQQKLRDRAVKVAKRQRKDDDEERHDDGAKGTWQSYFDPKDPSEQFSFANHRSYSKTKLKEDISLFKYHVPPWALRALQRGIAVHHSGMNKRYRGLIESLFRQGFLRVVIATGTLALGINAPAKTTVFCGDSPFLTALMYRQCAGRAGRRGYDLLGKVVFYGLSMDRVQRLILSRLPSLQGNFPLTSTLSLRLFNLLHGSDYAEVAVRTVNNIMSLSQISLRSDIGQQQLLHHLRFSIEYLRRARLLDVEGRPMNLFAIAAHLYYTEPSNLALVVLLRNGVLHQICRKNDADARSEFILLMSHLFGRRYLTQAFANGNAIQELVKKYPSTIVLRPLNPIARRVLIEHEQQTVKIYTEYARAYVVQYSDELGKDCLLPLSKADYSGSTLSIASPLRQFLESTCNRVTTRSAFVANSGHVDAFKSIDELTSTAREGLHLHRHAVPSFGDLTMTEEEKTLNAYIFDFYTHGQSKTLSNANGISQGDVWYLLQDFSLTLLTLRSSLEQLLSRKLHEGVQDEEGNGDTVDYAEVDVDRDEDDGVQGEGFKCPKGVSEDDWRVYEIVRDATAEFEVKYKAMWA